MVARRTDASSESPPDSVSRYIRPGRRAPISSFSLRRALPLARTAIWAASKPPGPSCHPLFG
jgi:hypothetical protein